jgi:hypothetical protein
MSCPDPWACAYPCDGTHVHSPFLHHEAVSDSMGVASQDGPGEARTRLDPEPRSIPREQRRKDLE